MPRVVMPKFICDALCVFSLSCLVPPQAEGICQNTFTYYSKEYLKCCLKMEELFRVMLDLCSYKPKL